MAIQDIPALAAKSAAATPLAQGPDLTRYLLVCGGMLALVVLLAWGFRRLVGNTLSARAAKRSMNVLDVLPLGGKQRLAVVKCYDRAFVLGVGDKELCLVAELDAEAVKLVQERGKAERIDFQGWLGKVRGKAPRSSENDGGGLLA